MVTTAQHEAVLHSSSTDLARRLAPRIGAALAADETVLAVVDPDRQAALRAELGDSADAVEFADPAREHTVPGFTVAVRWARRARAAATAGLRMLVVAQHVEDLPGCGPEHWARLDIALDVALAGLPVTMLCAVPNDTPQLARVRATHPVVSTAEGSERSAPYRPPSESIIEYPPPPPPELGPPVALLRFGSSGLERVRALTGSVADADGFDPDRTADIVLAVNELASNCMEHGPGSGELRLWSRPDALVAEVSDHGGGVGLPFPGITLPPPDGARGRGLWLASELSDVMQVWSDGDGTVIRVQLSR